MQPILDLVSEATGWKCSIIADGPEPAHGGRLNMIRYTFFFLLRENLAKTSLLVFTLEPQLAMSR